MNFSVTTVFSPLERAELKKQFHQKKKLEAQLNKVTQQAARSYKSTVQVKRMSRRRFAQEEPSQPDESSSPPEKTSPEEPCPSPPPPQGPSEPSL